MLLDSHLQDAGWAPTGLLQSQLALTQPHSAFCNSHVESHTL